MVMNEEIRTWFFISKPLKIPTSRGGKKKVKYISSPAEIFWSQYTDYEDYMGCYVFGIRAGKGVTPYYVGKATKSFKQEIFTSGKLIKYNKALIEATVGTPVMFLIIYPSKKGKVNKPHIEQLEKYLIQLGISKNRDLANIQGIKQPRWGVKNIVRSGQGNHSKDEKTFKIMMGIR